jgi:patatin-like phospholipase/acyl hydrolase
MAQDLPASSLRVLSLDGGGVKGYTSLLILKRIFRTLQTEANLAQEPKPCDVFDLIVGTSTGGLIAVMLGRLHMSIDECIDHYEKVGIEVFGKKPVGGQLGKALKGMFNVPFYDINILQDQIKKFLEERSMPATESFLEIEVPRCRV